MEENHNQIPSRIGQNWPSALLPTPPPKKKKKTQLKIPRTYVVRIFIAWGIFCHFLFHHCSPHHFQTVPVP